MSTSRSDKGESAVVFDPTVISVVKSVKTTTEQFIAKNKIDRLEDPKDVSGNPGVAPGAAAHQLIAKDEPCRLCCMSQGFLIAFFTCFAVASLAVGTIVYKESRVYYTFHGVLRQIGWLCIPGTLCGTTLHFFLVESMWSGKRSTWGQGWTKAFAANTAVWGAAIGAGTLFWRKGLRLTAFGRELHRRYPVPTTPLEHRVMRSEKEFFSGMGWSYWILGVVAGQMGFASSVSFCTFNDRAHYLMAPHGGYAARCLPKWRRDALDARAIK